MLALRYVYVLALVIWLGGMIVLGALVAPTTFQILQATEPATGRELAGEVFGAIIARFHYIAYGAGTVLLFSLAAMAVLGPRPRQYAVRSALIVAMLGVTPDRAARGSVFLASAPSSVSGGRVAPRNPAAPFDALLLCALYWT